MDVIFKSVVGKLWMTIIALFATVLTIFSLLLVQSLDSYYAHKQADDMKQLAERLTDSLQETEDPTSLLSLAAEVGAAYRTGLIVVDQNLRPIGEPGDASRLPEVPVAELVTHPDLRLQEVLAGQHPKPERLIFPSETEPEGRLQILAVAVPIKLGHDVPGALVMYQPVEAFDGTMGQVRKLIFIVGVIGFTLTTGFAFFLSSRITYPLRELKRTAQRIAEGEFKAAIPIKSTDELGDLAATFNTMASRLDELVDALSREKEQLSSVLRTMVDGVIMIDSEGRVVVTNPPAEQFLRDLAYERNTDLSPVFDLYKRVLQSGQEENADIPVQGRIWSVVMTPLYDRNQVRGAVAVLRDVTKERKLDKLRNDFIANVSHDLRTPLSMLQGYSEAIVDGIAATPEEHRELARIIYDESVRMTKLVNDLLNLARMESGHLEMNPLEIALRPYFERIHRKFVNLAREKGIHLNLEFSAATESAVFDPDRMEQVLTNLVDNALRHTPAEGMVTIRVSGEQPLVIEVNDTGSGIPQEDLPFVFERFYKSDKARTRGRSGTGLGLAIARHLVEAHGGTISVQSKWGEGTTFTIQLPRWKETKEIRSGESDQDDPV